MNLEQSSLFSRLIDVRQFPEFAGAHIEGAELVPLQHLAREAAGWDRDASLLLICKSGTRAEQARKLLEPLGFAKLEVLQGGIDAWMAAGQPVRQLAKRPWSMERQVRLGAGALVLVTMALALLVSKYFLVLTALIGAGLCFAGITDICMMANLLGRLPWNKPRTATRCRC